MAAICGPGLVAMAILNSLSSDRFRSQADPVEATVIRVETMIRDEATLFRATYTFHTPDGQELAYSGNTWTNDLRAEAGDVDAAWYRSDTQQFRSQARIDRDKELYDGLLALGVLSSLIGFGLLLQRRLRNAKED